MNVVFIVPTGIGAEIGGHAGDATPAAKLIASVCDNLITHPNVVNASDINEMPENALYVEGSILDRFLCGEIHLAKVRSNRILLVVNHPVANEVINSVSAARATIGADISIEELNTRLRMVATKVNGVATGEVYGYKELVNQIKSRVFDALAISTPIEVDQDVALDYVTHGGVNPWGGVEARASRLIATAINKPTAHSPFGHTLEDYNEVVDPRMAAEFVSYCYLHCVLKGLHKAPRVSTRGLSVDDVDCLISPHGCFGLPHSYCLDRGIPVVMVEENKTILNVIPPREVISVRNYLEAAGFVTALRVGVVCHSVGRPLHYTTVGVSYAILE